MSGTSRICGSKRVAFSRKSAIVSCGVLNQIPLVQSNHDRAPFPPDKIGNLQILLLERLGHVKRYNDHLGKLDRAKSIGN